MDLIEFDRLLEAVKLDLLKIYSTDGKRPWLDHMYEQVVSHRKRLAYSFDCVSSIQGRLLDVGSNMVFSCMYNRHRTAQLDLINYGRGSTDSLQCAEKSIPISLLDIQRDAFPYPDGTFDGVVFLEVVEHLSIDPMRTMAEINRVTRLGGDLLISTPNIISYRSIAAALGQRHPHLSSKYLPYDSTDRHNREYTPQELKELVESSGYVVEWMRTPSLYTEESDFSKLEKMLGESGALPSLRGDTIFIRARKVGPVAARHPKFLYF